MRPRERMRASHARRVTPPPGALCAHALSRLLPSKVLYRTTNFSCCYDYESYKSRNRILVSLCRCALNVVRHRTTSSTSSRLEPTNVEGPYYVLLGTYAYMYTNTVEDREEHSMGPRPWSVPVYRISGPPRDPWSFPRVGNETIGSTVLDLVSRSAGRPPARYKVIRHIYLYDNVHEFPKVQLESSHQAIVRYRRIRGTITVVVSP